MKLSTRGRYAVMAMVDLAKYAANDPISLAVIGERQEISVTYLEQLFLKLRQAGLVTSSRGVRGGYCLGRDPSDISIADIVDAVEEQTRVTRCESHSGKGCMTTKAKCLVHDLWDELGNQISLFLRSVTLEDVVEKRLVGRSQLFEYQERKNG